MTILTIHVDHQKYRLYRKFLLDMQKGRKAPTQKFQIRRGMAKILATGVLRERTIIMQILSKPKPMHWKRKQKLEGCSRNSFKE